MSVIHGANYGTPTLDLNFAENKSLIDTVSGQNLVTFSRSQANYRTTYVGSDGLIKYAGADEPRFDHDPLTGECLGLLIEEQRQNLMTYSQQITSQFYNTGYSGGVFFPNSVVAPDGTLTGSKLAIVNGGTDAWWGIYNLRTVSVVSGTAYTYSCFLKAGEISTVTLVGDVRDAEGISMSAVFTLSGSGSYVLNSGSSAGITLLTNGWYRCYITATAVNTNDEEPGIIASYAGNGSSGFYAWGLQFEQGSFPTSYIPTTAAAVTRSADQASITGTNFSRWYNPNSSTYYASVFSRATSKDNVAILGINGSDLERQVQFSANGGSLNSFQISTRVGGVYYLSSVSTISLGVPIKAAGIINGTEIKIGFNGTLGDSSSPPRIASSIPTTMDIGRFLADSQYSLNGTISRLTYYPTRLQNYQLQQLTK